MTVTEKKQTKVVYQSGLEQTGIVFRYNSSGKIKRPLVFNKNRNPLDFVVDWQLNDVEDDLLLD